MSWRLSRCRVMLAQAALLAACDPQDGGPRDAGASEVGDAATGDGRARDAASAPPAAPLQAIWGADSRRLEVWCSLGFGSISQFAADRDQLTLEQLRAAEALRGRLSGEDHVCYIDGASCIVDVVAVGGHRVQIRAPLELECDERHRLLTRASFQPLFDLLDCRAVSRRPEAPLKPHAHCDRGLYATGAGDIWVAVTEPGSYEFELAFCARPGVSQAPRMRLADETGTVLAEARAPADPGPRQTCQHLTHTFTQPGRFRIQHDAGVAEGGALSPMTLRFARAAAP